MKKFNLLGLAVSVAAGAILPRSSEGVRLAVFAGTSSALLTACMLAGTLASAVPAAATTLTFDTVTLASSDTPGAWSPDRRAPAGFATQNFLGDNRLALTLSSNDYTSDLFYDTQGRLYDLSPGSQYLSVQLYVTQDMINSPNRVTGLWGQAADPNNTPIIELAGGQFRGWNEDQGLWTNFGAPSAANQWYTLAIYHDAGQFKYYIDGVLLGSVVDDGATELVHAILEGENGLVPGTVSSTGDGVGTNATYYYDNLTFAASPTPIPAALPLFVSGLGVIGFATARRKRRKAMAA